MKRISLLIVVFIGFSAINGYGAGSQQLSELTEKVNSIDGNVKAIQNDKTLDNRLKILEEKLSQKDPSPDNKNEIVPAAGPQSIPIKWEIVSEQKENLGGLNYYVSKDISLIIPGLVKTSTRVRDGILEEIKDEHSEEKLEISKNDPGKMLKFSAEPVDRESLDIFFSAKSAILTFTRNKTKNCFELTSVRKDGREFLFKGEATQLCIKYKGGPLSRTTGEAERGQNYLTQAAVVDYRQRQGCRHGFRTS